MVNWKTTFKDPHFPCGEEMECYFNNASEEKVAYFINLWLSEGIPKIVLERPEEYQLLRENLASYLGIHSKEITLIGSARFGYSLNPKSRYRPFISEKSDLDLSIINTDIFEQFTNEFFEWLNDYDQGIVKPRGKYEKIYWSENKNKEPQKISRGIFDLNRIPAFPQYASGQSFLDKLSSEQKKWNIRNPDCKVKKITARLYKNWGSFVSQNTKNIRQLIK